MSSESLSDPRKVAHDLKNSLALLSTYPQLLAASDLDDNQREMVNEMLKAADQALRLHAVLEGLIAPEQDPG